MKPAAISSRLWLLLIAGCLIGLLAFGVRSSFGLFVDPISKPEVPGSFGFGREAFAMALAIQNLAWGIGQPIAGALADRYGPWRVIAGGGVLFTLGLVLMTFTSDPLHFNITAGLLIGIGMSGAGHNTVLVAFGQLMPPERRAWALGLGTATASLGQFLVVPIGQAFIDAYGWIWAVLAMAVAIATTPLLALALRAPKKTERADYHHQKEILSANTTSTATSLRHALGQAFGYDSYWLLLAGFFVCGFQLAFVTVHLPPYLNDVGLTASVASWSIALIGLFNVIGGYMSGTLSGRMSRKRLLFWIYLARAAVTTGFMLLPISPATALVFGATMGLLWLSTVPPTVQLVGVMFGNRYLSTLFGFVFLSHQIGAFVGVWLGGRIYAETGSYNWVWWISVVLALFAALVHLPIRETLYARAPTPSVSH
ncbi:MAG: MFS transporter [Burkholderiaceae bacterium]